jgi:hypothetical protein
MRILIRTSKWAIWARRFGSLAVPMTVLPVLMHREGLISSADFQIVETAAIAVALLALVLSVGAFVRLWVTGDRGWARATLGLLFSLVCLAPLAVVLWMASRYPDVGDVTTDFQRPPGLVSQVVTQPLTGEEQQAIATAFPNARSRSYPVEALQMYDLLTELVTAQGWEIRAGREPQTSLSEGQINAVATTLFGWRDEIAIRIEGDAQGSDVVMRSVALHQGHDLGSNGRRIEQFLVQLDDQITRLLRTAPATPDPPETEEP